LYEAIHIAAASDPDHANSIQAAPANRRGRRRRYRPPHLLGWRQHHVFL